MVIELLIFLYILLLGLIWYIITRNDKRLAVFFVKIVGVLVLLEMLYICYFYFVKKKSVCHMMKAIACDKQ